MLYAYGSKRYFPALIWSAKNYTFHRVVDFLLYVAYIPMISGPQVQSQVGPMHEIPPQY